MIGSSGSSFTSSAEPASTRAIQSGGGDQYTVTP